MVHTFWGEYQRKKDMYIVVYTDYAGNTITKNGMEISDDKMLLHRTGGFEGDMLFDPCKDTFVRYGAFRVQNGFMLHTDEYTKTDLSDGLCISLKYVLYDESENDKIQGEQLIRVITGEEA